MVILNENLAHRNKDGGRLNPSAVFVKTSFGSFKVRNGINKTNVGFNIFRLASFKVSFGFNKSTYGFNKTPNGDYRTTLGKYRTSVGDFRTPVGDYRTPVGGCKTN